MGVTDTSVPRWWENCTCRREERPLGRWMGVDMGRGMVRIGTTPNCPAHDTCRGFTKAHRARLAEGASWARNPYCPKHPKAPCPEATSDVR